MRIRFRKNGAFRLSAQNSSDSLALLKLLESMAGKDNDPNRLSLKKEAEIQSTKNKQP